MTKFMTLRRAYQVQGTSAKTTETMDYRTKFKNGVYSYIDPALGVRKKNKGNHK